MNSASQSEFPLSPLVRMLLVIGGAGLIALLATATWLEPSSRGHGTHEQLGLPPCSFWLATGVRCPSCGMTTSWALLMEGRVAMAVQANAGGVLLALAAIVGGPWMLASGLRGRWLGYVPGEWAGVGFVMLVLAVTIGDWLWRLLL